MKASIDQSKFKKKSPLSSLAVYVPANRNSCITFERYRYAQGAYRGNYANYADIMHTLTPSGLAVCYFLLECSILAWLMQDLKKSH